MDIKKLLEWFCCGDVGGSAKAIVFVMNGLPPKIILENNWTPYPHDSGDFGRCFELLQIFPDWRQRINEMKCLGKIWKRIAEHWGELEELYLSEQHSELYKKLQKLQPDEDEDNCDKISFGNGISISTPKSVKSA